ncbi:glucuronate isomerase [Bacillus sp. Marseille-Q3570]|uniref:glucuronate isomerase n=1 Tax=Bacillus sp. Marseille-Q3570 TaxID=2963522 RepID=UPI0021B81041|nr:glucuronate isomerase [Bacillus sp. Marseille-Q3570]
MKAFMDEDFLLETYVAKTLYHEYAKDMPIFDYHCHLSAKEIAENVSFSNMTEIWLNEDHYKWRALRSNGISEEYITGNQTDKAKFDKWAEMVPYLIGNPLYHWTHLELKRYFGITVPLNKETADGIWEQCNTVLRGKRFTAQELINRSNVKALCTTDDPLDDLRYHKQLQENDQFQVKVLPTFRPDDALNIEKESFSDFVGQLADVTGILIQSFDGLVDGLESRVEYFHQAGCRLSDHSLETEFYLEADADEINSIFKRRLSGQALTQADATKYKTAVLRALGTIYSEREWAMQLHIGGLRNNNTLKMEMLGPDKGFDSMGDFNYAEDLSRLLDSLEYSNSLPKTILYNLNPRDNYMLGSMIGNFQGERPGKIQFGPAWWFNDQRDGMEEQMKVLANVGLLSRFVGMLTDSRSLLSYTRHEYFRRILCNLIGNWVENGEYPEDYGTLGEIVKDICYNNIENYLAIESYETIG